MDRGVAVFGHHALADQNRIFEVVAVPRHEGHEHVLTQREFAQVGGCAVGDHITALQLVALLDDRTLVDVGVLVGTLVLDQVVDVHAHFTGLRFGVVDTNHHTGSVDIVHDTATGGRDHGAGVDGRDALDAGTDKGFLRTQHRHRLTLHVRAHQCAVRIVMLQEGHERRSDRHDLCRRHVHVLHALSAAQNGFAFFTGRHQLTGQHAVFVQSRIGLGNNVLAFFDGRQVIDVHRDLAIGHATVRGFNEAVLVQTGVQSQRVDQTNVRTFGRFNGAHTTVVGHVHVTHFKAGTLTRQTARAKCRHAALVGDLGQGIGLVHELAQLRGTEEFLECRRNRLGIDQVVRHQRLLLGLAQTLFDSLFDARQTGAVLVLSQFANATHAAVTQVVDVVDIAAAIAQVHQDLDDRQNVFIGQHHGAGRLGTAHLGVELHAAHAGQVIGVGVVEQTLEQRLHGVFGRRLAGAHHAVDGHTGGKLVHRLIGAQGLRNVSTLVQLIGVNTRNFVDTRGTQLFQQGFGQLFVGFGHDFAGLGFHNVAGHDAADQEVFGHADMRSA